MFPVRAAHRRWVVLLVAAALFAVPFGTVQHATASDGTLVLAALKVLDEEYVDPVQPVMLLNAAIATLRKATNQSNAVLPDIPTVAELGLAGFDATTWHGLVAPAGTPNDIIEALHRATVTALNDPATRKALGDLGVDIVGSSPTEFSAYIKSEIPKWRAVVQAAGGRLE